MNTLSALVSMLNRKVVSKSDALDIIDSVRAEIESGDDSVTVGEVLALSIRQLGASMSWVAAAFSLFGLFIGLLSGYLTL